MVATKVEPQMKTVSSSAAKAFPFPIGKKIIPFFVILQEKFLACRSFSLQEPTGLATHNLVTGVPCDKQEANHITRTELHID